MNPYFFSLQMIIERCISLTPTWPDREAVVQALSNEENQ